jgi:mitochondrial chaperone BCS1
MNFPDIIHTILQNQVVTGLSFTAVLGAIAFQLRNIPRMIVDATLRFMTVQLTVVSTDAAFDWVDRWLAQQPYARRAKMLTLRAQGSDEDLYLPTAGQGQSEPDQWNLSPGPGLHMFWWRRRPVFLDRNYLTKDGDQRRGRPVETLRFRTLGRSQQVIRRLIHDVHQNALATDMVSIRVWTDHYWSNIRGKKHRPLDSIILRDGQIERILDDITWFQAARHWYQVRGIPYRRGFLFSGAPGTGKTSLVMGLAGHFNLPICVLSISTVTDDNALVSAFSEAPTNAMILIEDVDCAYPAQVRESDEKATGRVTKAGLLNAIDGITTPDGRIFVMTTNFPDRLDPALVRPGRADVHEQFDLLGPTEQKRMALRFYGNLSFIPVIDRVSPALMQAAFMLYPTDPHAAHQYLANVLAKAA